MIKFCASVCVHVRAQAPGAPRRRCQIPGLELVGPLREHFLILAAGKCDLDHVQAQTSVSVLKWELDC